MSMKESGSKSTNLTQLISFNYIRSFLNLPGLVGETYWRLTHKEDRNERLIIIFDHNKM